MSKLFKQRLCFFSHRRNWYVLFHYLKINCTYQLSIIPSWSTYFTTQSRRNAPNNRHLLHISLHASDILGCRNFRCNLRINLWNLIILETNGLSSSYYLHSVYTSSANFLGLLTFIKVVKLNQLLGLMKTRTSLKTQIENSIKLD